MILQPPGGGGDPNADRRRAMMAQLLQGGPMPSAAQPNAAASLSNGLGAAMQQPEFQKYLQSLFGGGAAATQALPLTPGSMTMPGLY